MPFDYTSGNPDNLVGGGPARMQDIQGPFYDIRAYLNSQAGSSGGSIINALTAAQVLDVGVLNQRRAGRQLTNADFTGLGLSVPIGLWNLGDLTDVSGNGRVLNNKGAVPFGVGINGLSTTCAVFAGSTGQALYISDTGAADPFRIKTGSWGCWFRTAKRGIVQAMMGKFGSSAAAYFAQVHTSNVVNVGASFDGTTFAANPLGISDVADDRWHHVVGTFDGATLRVYVDGALEATTAAMGSLFAGAAPLNIGALAGDGATAAVNAFYGRVDEAFVTADVLSEDQVRCLYAAKIAHTLGTVPRGVHLNVNRYRKGSTFAVADFTAQPLRLHNFTGVAAQFADEGSNGVPLTFAGGTGGSIVVGADGTRDNAYGLIAASLQATDTGLPAGTATRSYGCWLKTASTAAMNAIGWGTTSTGDVRLATNAGSLLAWNAADNIVGSYIADGQWHQAVVVEDNSAGDGVRRKFYVDGRLVGGSTVLNAIVLAGANKFRVGANPDGAGPFTGQIDGAFVCNYAMAFDEIARLYAKGSQALGASPKNAGDHVERVDANSLLLIADTLDSQHTIDLGVIA